MKTILPALVALSFSSALFARVDISNDCQLLDDESRLFDVSVTYVHYTGAELTRVAKVELVSCSIDYPSSHFVYKKISGTNFLFHMEAKINELRLTDSACEWKISESFKNRFIADGYTLSNANIENIDNSSISYCASFHQEVEKVLSAAMEL